jgi:hypothetical protein
LHLRWRGSPNWVTTQAIGTPFQRKSAPPQGYSTAQIADRLWITHNTVQDHLKSIFDKTGVRSRREVTALILRDHYLPGLQHRREVGPAGYFT